jgi:hypothetical protein
MPAETINLPVIGAAKRTYVYAGGALVLGIVGYAWWKAQAAAPAPIDTGAVDVPVEELPGQSGGPAFASTGGGTSDTGAMFITTNGEWSDAALAKMIDLGYDSVQVSTALGKFLANQQVTATEASWIYTALGLVGEPPVGTHSVRLATSSSPAPTTSAPKTTVKTAATANWIGHRVTVRTTLGAIASHYAASKTPTGIYSTLKAIDARPENRSVYQRYGNNKLLPIGTVVLVPTWK